MLMRSLELRMIIVNTEFRRKKIDPFFFFSEAFKCKFSSFINFFPYYSYKPKPSHLRTQYASLDSVRLKVSSGALGKLISRCRRWLNKSA